MSRRLLAAWAVIACTACTRPDGASRESALPPSGPTVPPPARRTASPAHGLALLRHTRDSLPAHVGNALRCVSCHLDDGTRPGAVPWVGVQFRYPTYRAREGRVVTLEERINGCFRRSLAGAALPEDGVPMRAIVAYLASLSDTLVDSAAAGVGLARLPVLEPDTARGHAVYVARCAACHGADGAGTALATPVWGARSYGIGAGMSRLRTAAAFVRANMPHDRPGSLSPQEATDVAAYVNAHPRPDFGDKARDWPNGDPPPDVAYATDAAARRGHSPRAARSAE